MGGVGKELAYEIYAFMVRDVGGGLLTKRLSVEILQCPVSEKRSRR